MNEFIIKQSEEKSYTLFALVSPFAKEFSCSNGYFGLINNFWVKLSEQTKTKFNELLTSSMQIWSNLVGMASDSPQYNNWFNRLWLESLFSHWFRPTQDMAGF